MNELLRLSICDGKTGTCLFDLVWDDNYVVIPSSLGSLISSFYQIAREFGDKGGVSCIQMRPCSHAELFANSTFVTTDPNSAQPSTPTTPRSNSFPSAQHVGLPRDRTSSPPSFLAREMFVSIPKTTLTTEPTTPSTPTTPSIPAVASTPSTPSAASTPALTLIATEDTKQITSPPSEIILASSPPVPPSPQISFRAASLPSLPHKNMSPPLAPQPNTISSGQRAISPVVYVRPRTPSHSRPPLSLSSHLHPDAMSSDSESSDSSPSLPSTPTVTPTDPFSTPTTPTSDLLTASSTPLPKFEIPDSQLPPAITVTPPSYPPSPTIPNRVSRFLGHHKRRVKSSMNTLVRLTLSRDARTDTVVAVMHADNSRSIDFARSYASAIMKQFLELYSGELAHAREELDSIPESTPSLEAMDSLALHFKGFVVVAEKLKSPQQTHQ